MKLAPHIYRKSPQLSISGTHWATGHPGGVKIHVAQYCQTSQS